MSTAYLPSDPPDHTDALDRINAVSAAARTSWFGLLGYLAFVGITLLGVEDADFFVRARDTQLPLVGVSIPTASFFLFAPLLGAALYLYFHFQLLKLWQALAVPPPQIKGRRLADCVSPWLVNDFGLTLRGDGAIWGRTLDWLSLLATFILVFASGPIVLIAFWVRSFPAHDEWMTLGIGAALAITLAAFVQSMLAAVIQLLARRHRFGGGLWHLPELLLVAALLAPISTISWIATEDDKDVWGIAWLDRQLPENMAALREDFSLWPANLREVELIAKPADWQEYEVHQRAFRVSWCRDNGFSPDICGNLPSAAAPPPHQAGARWAWCQGWNEKADADIPPFATMDDCQAHFAELDSLFRRDWKSERRAKVDALPDLNLQNADLRRADLIGAFFPGSDLRDARLEGADLLGAQLEGATLVLARLEEADLRWARLEGAVLPRARLEGADLRSARLEGADLRLARLEGADLSEARLEGAGLSEARLEGANLEAAQLEGANLSEARLEGAVLFRARLEGADLYQARLTSLYWARAVLGSSPAQYSDLRNSTGLTQEMLADVIGNEATLLVPGLHVWSCWPSETAPAKIFGRDVPEGWLCRPEEMPQPTGTPCAIPPAGRYNEFGFFNDPTRAQCLDPLQNPHHRLAPYLDPNLPRDPAHTLGIAGPD